MLKYLEPDQVQDRKIKPLWYHKKGLMQTASGYGKKLSTEHMLKINNRWHRVHCCIFSNVGTLYIIKGGVHLIVDNNMVHP